MTSGSTMSKYAKEFSSWHIFTWYLLQLFPASQCFSKFGILYLVLSYYTVPPYLRLCSLSRNPHLLVFLPRPEVPWQCCTHLQEAKNLIDILSLSLSSTYLFQLPSAGNNWSRNQIQSTCSFLFRPRSTCEPREM